MNTNKQDKVFGGFRVTAEGRVFVSDLALLQDVQKELEQNAYSANAAEPVLATPNYSPNF